MIYSTNSRNGQRGAVLVVALIMLAVMTLLVITMIKTAVLDLKIGGASQQAAVNLANADVSVNTYLVANPGSFSIGCLNRSNPEPNCKAGIGTTGVDLTALYGSQVVVTATESGCVQTTPGDAVGKGLPSVYFDVRARSSGMFAGIATTGETAVHQGIRATAPAGACGS